MKTSVKKPSSKDGKTVTKRVKFELPTLTDKQTDCLSCCFFDQNLPLDRLPYTKEFNKIVKTFQEAYGKEFTPFVIYNSLLVLKKEGKLSRRKES